MIVTKTECKCDLCKTTKSYTHIEQFKDDFKELSVPVVFLTEQDEGRPCKPYFSNETILFCNKCYDKFLKKYPITGIGAQGYNSYKFVEESHGMPR